MEVGILKSSSSVRRPSLVDSRTGGNANEASVGETLRKAKRDLFFRRCLLAIFLVLIITFVVAMFTLGYAGLLADKIIAWIQ